MDTSINESGVIVVPPKISVVLPYRDRAEFLPRTIRSLSAIRYIHIEYIFVDNASTDNSAEVVAQNVREYLPNEAVKHIQEPREGAANARNAGLEAADGDYVYFFDSDDEVTADFFDKAGKYICDNECDILATATRMVFPNGKTRVRKHYLTTSVRDQILTGMLATQGMMFRRKFLESIGGWRDLPMWNDWELGVRALLAKPRVHWLRGAYHRIHQHADSLTGTSAAAVFPRQLPALRAVEELPLSEIERRALAARKAILAALVSKDNSHADDADALLKEAIAVAPKLQRLYRYTKTGLPGAWWIARKFY